MQIDQLLQKKNFAENKSRLGHFIFWPAVTMVRFHQLSTRRKLQKARLFLINFEKCHLLQNDPASESLLLAPSWSNLTMSSKIQESGKKLGQLWKPNKQ